MFPASLLELGRTRELLRVPLHPRRKIRAHSRCNSKPVAHEMRWLKGLLGNFRGLSSACFFKREWARMAANFHEWHSWEKAIYQAGRRGRAKRPGEPMGRPDAGNRPGSAGTPRPTSFQSMGAEEPGRDVMRASIGNPCESLYATVNPKEARHSCRAVRRTRELQSHGGHNSRIVVIATKRRSSAEACPSGLAARQECRASLFFPGGGRSHRDSRKTACRTKRLKPSLQPFAVATWRSPLPGDAVPVAKHANVPSSFAEACEGGALCVQRERICQRNRILRPLRMPYFCPSFFAPLLRPVSGENG